MELSNWVQFNPHITLGHTTKKYFNKYLYKLVLFAPACRLVDTNKSLPMAVALDKLTIRANESAWVAKQNQRLDLADVDFLETLRTLRNSDSQPGTKMRVENMHVAFYTETEQELLDLVNKYFTKSQHQYVVALHGPESERAKKALEEGAILRKKNSRFSHIIKLRSGKYSKEVKDALYKYLSGLGEEIANIPSHLDRELSKRSIYIWNAYLYTNDPSIATFIDIIQPGMVSKCYKVVVLDSIINKSADRDITSIRLL